MNQYWLEIVTLLGINCIVALGVYVIMLTNQLQAGQAAFMGVGAYTAALLTIQLRAPFIIALLLGALLAALVGLVFSILALRLRHFFLAVATLGFGEALTVFAFNMEFLGGASGLQPVPLNTTTWGVYAILAVQIYFFARFENSRTSLAFRAIADDEVTAGAMGINVRRQRIVAFVLGCFMAGIGGGLFAHMFGLVEPRDLDFLHSLTFLVFVAFGGIEVFTGALLGALILTVLPELLRFSLYDRYLIYGLLLIVMMVFRPKGLLTRRPLGPRDVSWTARLFGRPVGEAPDVKKAK